MSSAKKNEHRLLKRQLRKALGRNATIPSEWRAFLDLVNDTYVHGDEDREMLERSLELSSKELLQTNRDLVLQKQELEEAVKELRSTQQELVESQEMLVLSKKLEKAHQDLLRQKEELEKANGDLLEAQSKLVHAEKMTSLGQLTAGVAHEINNPVNFIYAGAQALKITAEDIFNELDKYTQLVHCHSIEELQRTLSQINTSSPDSSIQELKQDLMEMVKTVESGAERTAEIVKGLKSFARVDTQEAQYVDVTELIDSTLVMLSTQVTDKIRIEKEYSECPEVSCYPGQLNQVFMNILHNAVQATGEEGVIRISTHNLENTIEVRVKDEGPGIPEELISKIFDPFFTTKDVGEGTGLGLSISYNIIEEMHKGKISVESKKGKGATFIVSLPKFLGQ